MSRGNRSWLLGPTRAVANVNNETIVACFTRSFPARPHSLGSSLARGADIHAFVRAQGNAPTVDASSAAEISALVGS